MLKEMIAFGRRVTVLKDEAVMPLKVDSRLLPVVEGLKGVEAVSRTTGWGTERMSTRTWSARACGWRRPSGGCALFVSADAVGLAMCEDEDVGVE